MGLISTLSTIFYGISLPVMFILKWIMIAFSPLLHLGQYTFSLSLMPMKIIEKFETLYVFCGIAALVGLFAGFLLHFVSENLASFFNLDSASQTSVLSVTAQDKSKFEKVWESSTVKKEPRNWGGSEWSTKDGLLGQTILEEEDSEDGY